MCDKIPIRLQELLKEGVSKHRVNSRLWVEIGEAFAQEYNEEEFNAAVVAIHYHISGNKYM